MKISNYLLWTLVMIAGAVAAPLPAGAQVVVQKRQTWSYEQGGLVFSNMFAGARLNDVTASPDAPLRYTLTIDREGPRVTNVSSWYAFAIESTGEKTVEVVLSYAFGRHRYAPKVRHGESGEWLPLPSTQVRVVSRTEVILTLRLSGGRTYVAGGPMTSVADQELWAAEHVKKPFVRQREYGRSAAGVPLRVLETQAAKLPGARTVIVMTWQHPPEFSGVRAFRAFVDTLLADTPEARAFRDAYGLMIVPVANPDGVNEGHWRHNLGDVDLNRDWRKFGQPETRALRDLFKQVARPALFLDYHSTRKTLFYTQLDEEMGTPPTRFTVDWTGALQARFPAEKITRDTNHNPNTATSRNWAASELKVPSITVELADDASFEFCEAFGRAGAEDMMRLLMAGAR